MMKKLDLTGKRFGELTVVRLMPERSYRSCVWECRCDCGRLSYPLTGSLQKGASRSCGCRAREAIENRIRHTVQTSDGDVKYCVTCKQNRPIADFGKDSRAVCGLRCSCRDCRIIESRQRYETRDKKSWTRRARESKLKRVYGITGSVYADLYTRQGGLCAVCRQGCQPRSHFDIDHSHATGKVRGLLCRRCNNSIGLFHENPVAVLAAVHYLTDGGSYSRIRASKLEPFVCKRVCEICSKADSHGTALALDHDHTTEMVRGRLCRKCNMAIGLMQDNRTTLASMAAYLAK